jgi:uncharacterized protein YndB with AHSA1/START domain
MITLIIIVTVVLIAALLIFATTRPDSFRIQRSLSIKAPPGKIFPLINDFHEWETWSPWEKVDPALKRTYSGNSPGKCTIYEWSGNKEIGQGRMEIIESSPPSRLVIRIDFITPIEAHNTIEFTLEAQGDSTMVTQAMYGPNSYLAKVMGLFFSMDKMIGQKFDEGLASIKAIAEE